MVCKVRAQGLFRASGALVSFACHLSGFLQLAVKIPPTLLKPFLMHIYQLL